MTGGTHFDATIPLTPREQFTGDRKEAESTDPFIATAVMVDTPGYDGMEAMARCFVEEFARSGWPRQRIQRMFAMPAFAAPHAVYQSRGASFVDELIDGVLGPVAQDPIAQDEEF